MEKTLSISPKFAAFLPIILQHEGGFVNDPDDPGGATNYGITFQVFKANAALLGLPPTVAALKALTTEQAGMIYQKDYWEKIMGDAINDAQCAYQYVDFYINAGGHAIKVMQATVNQLGQKVTEDGAMGPSTLKALNNTMPEQLFNTYKKNRASYYENLVQHNPVLGKFLKGWLNRTNSFVYKV